MDRQKVRRHFYFRLIITSALVGGLASILALLLKTITIFCQDFLYETALEKKFLFVIFPTIGITGIYFLRKYFFKNRKNKGITEIYKTVDQRKDHLPLFKIPSHFINGFLTVIFGGSTGIEVSTVVASATIGNNIYQNRFSPNLYKLELICAGVVAGVSILFGSPIVGWLFAVEVIAKKLNKSIFVSCTMSAMVAWGFLLVMKPDIFLDYHITDWKWSAFPFFIVLSLLGGTLSVYFTLLVTRLKNFFSGINNNFFRVNLGATTVGLMILVFPFLYGDSYHALAPLLQHPTQYSMLFLLSLVVLKPLASALTLGAGGDGGVFAPSIVVGGFLGFLFAYVCNNYLGTSLIYLNFMLVGAAATLSASIYAPLTALFLVCNLAPNAYVLFFPLLMASFISRYFAGKLLPYNVYTYQMK
ncbi:chloride channel protein, CIC family [Soonwooa buanensis]|uniref:Chloride channel protein, CIC family n=1 Tax=Soonwooa buanensis TaxID=619805 RepID=A0A1T5ETF5_9FLAO|nr:chloride channel protein [Soonwooa buanensis]SKB86990.1 chloride channel protein, CIC family [Soonwooa buanensis]